MFFEKAFLKTNLKSHKCVLRRLQPPATRIAHFKDDVFDALEGEQIDLDKWEVVDEQDYVEDYDDWADTFIMPKEKKEFAA